MPDQETIDYYNSESDKYSEKRYPKKTLSYTQYLFKRRLNIFLNFLNSVEHDLPQNASILEIGCADGIIFKALEKRFPGRFKKLVGMDISPKMIEEAKNNNTNSHASFFVKDDLPEDTFDLVVELGVLPDELNSKLQNTRPLLNGDGYFIYNLVGSRSTFAFFKLRRVAWARGLGAYSFYDKIIKKYFSIRTIKVNGLFFPKLWRVPAFGRVVQPLLDTLFGSILPELFHEKIYLLKKKN